MALPYGIFVFRADGAYHLASLVHLCLSKREALAYLAAHPAQPYVARLLALVPN